MLTTDPIFWKPYRARIRCMDLGKTTTYYTYDSLTDIVTSGSTSDKPTYARVQLGLDHTGSFEVQFEDSSGTFPTGSIYPGQRLYIDVSKDSSIPYVTLISGLIRRRDWERGIGGKNLYTVSGSSTMIRTNEVNLYFVQSATKNTDGSININDANMKADAIVQSALASETSLGIINAGSLAANSDVENFISDVEVSYGEIQDVINLVEEHSGGEFIVDTADNCYLRHQYQPYTSGRGFILTTVNGSADNADYTGYISPDSPFTYSESKFKSDGYWNRAIGILPAENNPSALSDVGGTPASTTASSTASTLESAVKFKPSHSHFLPGDFFIFLCEIIAGTTPFDFTCRICRDSGGLPQNSGGIIANVYFPRSTLQIVASTDLIGASNLTNQQVFFNTVGANLASFDLDTTTAYWFIFSNSMPASAAAGSVYSANSLGLYKIGATRTSGSNSTVANGGTGWVANSTPIYVGIPRRRAHSFIVTDPKAIKTTGSGLGQSLGSPIYASLSNVASSINTKESMHKYMINQAYNAARPKVFWPSTVITPPNVPILPNDPIMIVDDVIHLSASGSQAVTATTGDMVYEFGSKGGEGNVFRSNMYLSITPVGFANHY